jgi:hypothetical protein
MDLELEVELPPSIATRGREADMVVAVPDMSGRSRETGIINGRVRTVIARKIEMRSGMEVVP